MPVLIRLNPPATKPIRQQSDPPMDAIVTLGKYEIRQVLGRGAMGVVYEGWDPSIQRRVAIKTVPVSDATDAETLEQIARFRREAQAAGRLTHPNIVSVYDYGETPELAYIVMEFVDGPTLKDMLEKQERFALPDILKIMRDLLAGLEFSHERGVVHRDIKPANLMLTSADRTKSRTKISDFGIARIESSNMTQAGTMMGTPNYMSPEQFMGQTVDPRTDIYSSGVLLYQLLTGERPFEGGLSALMHKVLHTEPPAPSQISVTVSPAMDAVVKKAMAKRPDDRFPSAAAFLDALNAAAAAPAPRQRNEDATLVASGPASPTRVPAGAAPLMAAMPAGASTPAKRSAVPMIAAAAVVALLAAGGGGFFLMRSPGNPSVPVSGAAPSPAAPTTAPALPTSPTPAPAPPAPQQQAAIVAPSLPPAPTLTAAEIRERMARIVATQPCAFLNGTVTDSGVIALRGIAGTGAQENLRQDVASKSVPGQIDWRAASSDRVFCPVLDILQSIAPPFGVSEPHLALTLANDLTALHDGQRIRPRIVMPDFPAFVRVDYITHDGNVQHLYPQIADRSGVVADKPRLLAAGERLNLGDPPPGQPAWEVSEPYGTDLIMAVASSQPLFDKPRPSNVEKSDVYLRDLTEAVASARAAGARQAGNGLLVDTLPK